MEIFLLYLWMKLDTLRTVWATFALAGGLGLAFIWVGLMCEDKWDNYKSPWTKVAVVWGICLSLFLIVPSSNQMAGLVVGGVALNAAETPEAQKLLGLLRKRANDYLDEQLKGK